jgi:PAS domain S-box-containing protein
VGGTSRWQQCTHGGFAGVPAKRPGWYTVVVLARGEFATLFSEAFMQSRNAMVLLDGSRRHVDVNGASLRLTGYQRDQLIGRPISEFVAKGSLLMSQQQWEAAIAAGRFTGRARLVAADGSHVSVQYAAATDVVTGRRLILFVELSSSRWGAHFRRPLFGHHSGEPLSAREIEIVRLVALGMTDREIAAELQIAHHTVRTHVRNAMGKTDARSRAHLVAKALADGLVLGAPNSPIRHTGWARAS